MRAVDLFVEPFKFISYTNIECTRQLNDHGSLKITGMIAAEQVDSYRRIAREETWVCVKVKEEKEETVFFYGVMTSFGIKEEGQVYTATMEVQTGSYLLDLTPHIRSFQEDSLTYDSVLERCVLHQGGNFISTEKGGQAIGSMLLQYQETDWEFIKRLAHRVGAALVPEFVSKGKRFYFGCPENRKKREIATEDYRFLQIYESHGEVRKNQEDWHYLAAPHYGIVQIVSREVYQLGDTAVFQGILYRIGKMVSRLVGEELVHEYDLFGMYEAPELDPFCDKIAGISLTANVKAVQRDKVQVVIQKDENKNHSKHCWFDYATVYSTPDGTGWYCMPEVGDEVRLTFPEADESRAYVASSVHLQTQGGRSNPDQKSWRNKQNKEILFTPDALILRNNKGLLMELSDSDGIKIISNQGILMEAGKDVQISSKNAAVHVNGKDQIALTQGCAQIVIAKEINVSGGKINMN